MGAVLRVSRGDHQDGVKEPGNAIKISSRSATAASVRILGSHCERAAGVPRGSSQHATRRGVRLGQESTFGVAARRFRQDQRVATIHEVQISGETIRLGQLLKLSGLAETGGASKALLADGVRVNGVAETRRGRQLRAGDVVEALGETARVVAA